MEKGIRKITIITRKDHSDLSLCRIHVKKFTEN